MSKHRHILFNELNLMKRCPVCNKKWGEVYCVNIPQNFITKIEKSCYKCTTIIDFIFRFEKLVETSFITDNLKLEIDHVDKKSILYRREITYSTISKEYVQINWVEVINMNKEFEFDLNSIKDIKAKMQALEVFS